MAIGNALWAAAAASLFFILPGYLGWVAFGRTALPRRPVSWRAFFFTIILGSALWTGGLGVSLLQFGIFSLTNLAIGTATLVIVLVAVNLGHKRTWVPELQRSGTDLAVFGLLIAAAVALFFHPHEFILGGADAGVYINLGASIARTGHWVMADETVAEVPVDLDEAFFRQQPSAEPPYIQFPGFYLTDAGTGEITPQFYPLHPLWLAVFNAVGGLRISLYATPVWGVLGVWAVGMVAGSLFGKRSGLLTIGLLTLTATQIWFSRYPTSEVLTQFLLFGGIWALIRYLDDDQPWYGLLAGLALGEAMLARLDLYFLAAIPLAYALQRLIVRKLSWRDLSFAVPFCGLMGQSLVFARTQSWPYFSAVYGRVLSQLLNRFTLLIIGAFASLVIAVLLVRYFRRGRGRAPEVQQRLALVWHAGMRCACRGASSCCDLCVFHPTEARGRRGKLVLLVR